MRDKVRAFIAEHRLLAEGDSVIAALSGGADSVSLVHVLVSFRDELGIKVYAAHFNHMIRGSEADRDEDFARSLCEGLGVEFYAARADVPAIARQSKESLELCGRRLRYAFLTELAGRLSAKVATAHNLSDNTETVLMNLVRGTGISGLRGIPVKRDGVIRPLLCCSRGEIEAYCRENGLSYMTDSTNLDDAYTRNRLRLNILPQLREMNPSLDESVMRMAGVMRDADEYLIDISDKELNRYRTACGYSCDGLLSLEPAVLSYALRGIAQRSGAPLDSAHTRLVVEAMMSGGAVELGGGYRAECAQGILRITEPSASTKTGAAGETPFIDYAFKRKLYIKDGRAYSPDRKNEEIDEKINKKFFNNLIPCDIITDVTVVRTRRAGDTFTDARRGVTKTVKKLLNELKVPRERRDSLAVAANGSAVLWIEGIGTSAAARVDSGFEGEVYQMYESL